MNKAILSLFILAILAIHSLPTDNPLSRTLNGITLYNPMPSVLKDSDITDLGCFSEVKRLLNGNRISHKIWYSAGGSELMSALPSISSEGVTINSIKIITIQARRISLLFLDNNLTTYQITLHNGIVQNISQNAVWMPLFYSDLLI